ncbi:hypothetical protein [Ruania halotolerans]|uniref:hypothetical protein n=1 Tax=Ruania halotolerans TaxID=2897773 RepID=UPI001E49F5C6|nr:hypothetical protein [Ruania halotolerans]UFU07087.1 hypothetical protein LQF10_02950 [Ruania halotolerans]
MADIYISLDELREVSTQLGDIVEEFENATSNSEALEAAIGNPFGEGKLRSEAREFEERWDDKRGDLKEALVKVQEHVDGVIEGVQQWDAETAIALEPEE